MHLIEHDTHGMLDKLQCHAAALVCRRLRRLAASRGSRHGSEYVEIAIVVGVLLVAVEAASARSGSPTTSQPDLELGT